MKRFGGFQGRLVGPLLQTGLLLMKNVLTPSPKSVLIPLGLTTAESSTDAVIRRNVFGSGMHPLDLAKRKILITLKEEMDGIMKMCKSLEDICLLIKGISEAFKNEPK